MNNVDELIMGSAIAFNNEHVMYLGEMHKLRLNPGDVLVLSCDHMLSDLVAGRIRTIIQEKFPGHEILVLSGGMKLGIVETV